MSITNSLILSGLNHRDFTEENLLCFKNFVIENLFKVFSNNDNYKYINRLESLNSHIEALRSENKFIYFELNDKKPPIDGELVSWNSLPYKGKLIMGFSSVRTALVFKLLIECKYLNSNVSSDCIPHQLYIDLTNFMKRDSINELHLLSGINIKRANFNSNFNSDTLVVKTAIEANNIADYMCSKAKLSYDSQGNWEYDSQPPPEEINELPNGIGPLVSKEDFEQFKEFETDPTPGTGTGLNILCPTCSYCSGCCSHCPSSSSAPTVLQTSTTHHVRNHRCNPAVISRRADLFADTLNLYKSLMEADEENDANYWNGTDQELSGTTRSRVLKWLEDQADPSKQECPGSCRTDFETELLLKLTLEICDRIILRNQTLYRNHYNMNSNTNANNNGFTGNNTNGNTNSFTNNPTGYMNVDNTFPITCTCYRKSLDTIFIARELLELLRTYNERSRPPKKSSETESKTDCDLDPIFEQSLEICRKFIKDNTGKDTSNTLLNSNGNSLLNSNGNSLSEKPLSPPLTPKDSEEAGNIADKPVSDIEKTADKPVSDTEKTDSESDLLERHHKTPKYTRGATRKKNKKNKTYKEDAN